MKVLVTGCAGFIGSHICERLLSIGNEVIGIDNFDTFYSKDIKAKNLSHLKSSHFQFFEISILDASELNKIYSPIDAIIHLAANAGVRPSIQNPPQYIDTNITGTYNIVSFAKEKGINKIVFASSSSVYGNTAVAPFVEDANTDAPISPYAFTKKAGELILYNFYHLYNINSVALRFFTVYGPRQRPDLAINKFVSLILDNKPIDIYGDGSFGRDYTFIDDTVDGILGALNYLMKNNNVFEVINLGNSKPVTVVELVAAIEKVLNRKAKINFEKQQPGDVQLTCADIAKAERLLQYKPKTSLNEGLELFYKWKLSN
jgi:nucleoside-diphosphate-sugar epimerase